METMLSDGPAATRLPAQDLDRARRFYSEKLGLEPAEERPGGLLYRCGGTEFALFQSAGASPGTFTQSRSAERRGAEQILTARRGGRRDLAGRYANGA